MDLNRNIEMIQCFMVKSVLLKKLVRFDYLILNCYNFIDKSPLISLFSYYDSIVISCQDDIKINK